MAEIEREEGGISVGDIFRIIFSQKWLALSVMVLVTLASTLWLYIINKPKIDYVITFSIDLPGANNTDSYYSYPDGSKFYYVDYVTPDVLNKVKASDSAFADVDVDKIVKGGNINFTETIEAIESVMVSDKEVSVINRRTFDIKINASAFKNADIARNFMKALAVYPSERFSGLEIDYNIYLQKKDFDDALTYGAQLDCIRAESDLLNSLYSSLSSVNNSTLIASRRQEFNAWLSRVDLDALTTEAESNYYLKDWETSIAKYENQLAVLKDNIEDANRNLTEEKKHLLELANSGVQASDAASVVKELQTYITSLERQKTTLNKYIEAYYYGSYENGSAEDKGDYLRTDQVKTEHIAATKEYAKKIQKIYDEMTAPDGYIAAYSELSKDVYEHEATVSFMTPNYIMVDSQSLGLVKSILISLAIGIVAALVIAFIVGLIVNKKKSSASKAAIADDKAAQLEIPLDDNNSD